MIPVGLAVVFALVFGVLCSLAVFVVMLLTGRGKTAELTLLKTENASLLPLRSENEQLKIEAAKLQAEKQGIQALTDWVDAAKAKMGDTFTALASTALKDNCAQFIEQSKREVGAIADRMKGDLGNQKTEVAKIVEPLNKDLEKLERQVQELEQKREGAYSGLISQVSSLKQGYETLNTTTTKLQEALRSTTTRGKWGQMALRNVVEMAGMTDHVDFDEQQTTSTGDRPDMIIHLPNKGIIPIDAKVPLTAYLDAVGCQDPERRAQLFQAHRDALRTHVRALSRKAYWAQFENTPEFVVLFVPYESGLEAAFAEDAGLLQEALESKVIIVSPATLLALLKAAAVGWLQLQLAKSAKEIADQAKELMNRILVFAKHFNDIGKRLNGCVETYNAAGGSMESRVMPALRKLKEMGTTTEELPEVAHAETKAKLLEGASSDLGAEGGGQT